MNWRTPLFLLTTMLFTAVWISHSMCVRGWVDAAFPWRSLRSPCQASAEATVSFITAASAFPWASQHSQLNQRPWSVLSNSYPSTYPNGFRAPCPKPYVLITSGLRDKFLHTSPNAGTQLRRSFRKSLVRWKCMPIVGTDENGYTWTTYTIGSVWAANAPHDITVVGRALWCAVLSVWIGLFKESTRQADQRNLCLNSNPVTSVFQVVTMFSPRNSLWPLND